MQIARHVMLSALFVTATGPAFAGALDRSGQSVSIIFEEGRRVELSFGFVAPDGSGEDLPPFAGTDSGDVLENYFQFGAAYKADINNQLSYALIYDQPFGADTMYPDGDSAYFGGTLAKASSHALTGVLRYKFNDNVSVHGGLRAQSVQADVELRGAAYGAAPPGGFNGYNVYLDREWGFGYLLGGAYERKDIALRVALTYNSSISYDLDTEEEFGPLGTIESETTIETPQSVNLEFQTGIMADTLLFGAVRWVDWSEFDVTPEFFDANVPGGGALVEYDDDIITYTLGVGRRFTDQWSGAVQVGYEKAGDKLVSPLGPTTGNFSLGVGATYTMDNMEITGGIRHVWLGDADPETGTPDVARAEFRDNTAIAAGLKIAYTF